MHTPKNIIKNILRHTAPLRLRVLSHTIGKRFPVHVSMTASEAESVLTTIQPDIGGSCLCSNEIKPVADLHVIIPVYNTERYLADCLNSVYTQMTRFSFFVSIIDDGSTDGSLAILEKYRQSLLGSTMYDRTEIIHQNNSGPSMARNRALDCIRGHYVTFVDSDDMLLPGAIESMMSAAIEQDADIAEGNTDSGSTHGMACGKIYSAGLFRTVHFPPGYWFEDTINIFFLYPTCHKRIQVPGRHYFYRNNTTSIMHSFHGNARAMDSLWVSRRVLTEYFTSGHPATVELFIDFMQDSLSTATHCETLGKEQVMQALFVILSNLAHTYFADMLTDPHVISHLPYAIRHTAKAFAQKNYRSFRVIQASACNY